MANKKSKPKAKTKLIEESLKKIDEVKEKAKSNFDTAFANLVIVRN